MNSSSQNWAQSILFTVFNSSLSGWQFKWHYCLAWTIIKLNHSNPFTVFYFKDNLGRYFLCLCLLWIYILKKTYNIWNSTLLLNSSNWFLNHLLLKYFYDWVCFLMKIKHKKEHKKQVHIITLVARFSPIDLARVFLLVSTS